MNEAFRSFGVYEVGNVIIYNSFNFMCPENGHCLNFKHLQLVHRKDLSMKTKCFQRKKAN